MRKIVALGDFIEDTKALAPLEQAIKSNLGEATTKILIHINTKGRKSFKNEIWSRYEYRSYFRRSWIFSFQSQERELDKLKLKHLRKLKHPSRSKQLKSFLES